MDIPTQWCLSQSLAAKASGTKVFMKSETHLGLTRSEWKQKVRDGVLGVLYRGLDGALAIGTENRRYYRHLGVPEERSSWFHMPWTTSAS